MQLSIFVCPFFVTSSCFLYCFGLFGVLRERSAAPITESPRGQEGRLVGGTRRVMSNNRLLVRCYPIQGSLNYGADFVSKSGAFLIILVVP
jgi:hypothetical protein